MLGKWMLNLGELIFDIIFAMLGVLPDLPTPIINVIDFIFDLLFDSVSLVSIFLDFNMIKLAIPIFIAIYNFDHLVKLVMFILKKIPILGIE